MNARRLAMMLIVLLVAVSAGTPQPAGPRAPRLLTQPPLFDADILQRLEQVGLVVLPDGMETNLHDCYYSLEMSGQPMYITSDAMLYLWYEAHRQALMAVEKQWLRPQLGVFADRLVKATQALRQAEDGPDSIRPLLRRNAVMLEVTCCLLDPARQPLAELATDVNAELARVREHKLTEMYPGEDYTQYEVRGYYTRNSELSNYFRGAKYLARRYFRVADAKFPAQADEELRRALLLALAMRPDAGLADLYRQIVDLRVFLCGPIDTIGLDQLLAAANAVWGEGWGREKLADLGAIRRELLTDKYPTTRINTRVTDPFFAKMPPKNIALLGEHYLPDSDLFHQTTEPKVPARHLPSGLDVATALGSPLAADKLREQAAGLPPVVPAAQAFGQTMKLDGVYGTWLGTLKTLFDQPAGLPAFAKTSTYEAKQLNCCLTSWAQLRHNYILYGAQANTCAGMAPASPGIVEPLPGFFAAYGQMCRQLREKLVACHIEGRTVTVLQALEEKAATFERCANDQLAGRDTAWATGDIHGFAGFIRTVYFDSPLLVADVATSSQTEEVLHAASGPFRKVIVRYLVKGEPVIAQGWVGSYYEFAEPHFGRLTDEEWQKRLGLQYTRPEPPLWLAGLYQPQPGEQTGQRQRLREIESLLAADRLDEAKAAAEAFIKQEQDTEWAPAAVLLVGRYLLGHKHRDEGLAMLERARPMVGCNARDAAMRSIRNYSDSYEAWQDRRAEQERKLAEQIAATDPKPGLTDAQELERQNKRAALLLGLPEGGPRYGAAGPPDALRRLVAECPKSGYLPYAEVALALSPLPDRYGRSSADDEPDPRMYGRARADLLALAQKYANSSVGQAARVAACSMLSLMGEYEAGYREALPLLDLDPPKPEPYPLSARILDDSSWSYGGPGGTMTSPKHLALDLLEHLMPSACQAGELALVQSYLALVAKSALAQGSGDWDDLPVIVSYLKDEPEALKAALPLLNDFNLVPGHRYDGTEAGPADQAKRALQLADQFPATKTARAVLLLAWEGVNYGDECAQLAKQIQQRLAQRSPDSLENLAVQAGLAAQRDDVATYHRLMAKIRPLTPQASPEVTTYPQFVIRHTGHGEPQGPPDAATVAAWKQRYAKFITAAGLKPSDFTSLRYEGDLTAALIKRLPQREVEIILVECRHADDRYSREAIIGDAIERHPKDPLVYELRFVRGGLEDMAAIIAHGPKTTHYAEAIERFCAWTPSEERRSSLDQDLYGHRTLAAHYAGTAVEPLACAMMATIYLHYERPEQALKLVTEKLAAIPPGRPLRERLVAQQANAERQVALKRASANPPLWTAPLPTADSPYGDDRRPGPVLAPDASTVFARGVLPDGRVGIAALGVATGRRRWQAPCPDLQAMQCVGDGLVFATGHGTAARLDGRDGHVAWETPLGLAQVSGVWLATEGDSLAAYWEQGVLAALDPATGRVLWQRNENLSVGRYSPGTEGCSPLTICRGVVAAWDQADTVRAWRVSDGQPVWSVTAKQVLGPGAPPMSVGHGMIWPVAVAGKLVVGLRGSEGVMACLDPASGAVLWRKSHDVVNSALSEASAQAGAVFAFGEGQVAEWVLADGAVRWHMPWPPDSDQVPPFAVAGGCALVVADDLLVLDRRTGQVVARQPLAGAGQVRALAAASTDGGVRAIILTNRDVRAFNIAIAR